MLKRFAAFVILGAVAAMPALPQNADPPRRAARLGYFEGTVTFKPAGVDDWTPAELNRPMTTGDEFWTEDNGRAELQTDNAAMRFGGRTDFAFVELGDAVTHIKIASGILNVRLHDLAAGEVFEIDTPQLSFTLKRFGAYRVEASEQGDTTLVTVRMGDAEINAGGQITPAAEGKQVRVTAANTETLDAPPTDPFDAWCIERDGREDSSATAAYVSRDIPGYADLDASGNWRPVDPYGPVWFPNVDAQWAPYRVGHWVFVDPWGWTWVDDAPWGYAPFHFGRWVQVDGAWGWVPGKPETPGVFVIRPYYAPALVAFADFSPGVVVADAVLGWFPLGPGEVWVPAYTVSAGYLEQVNATNAVPVDRKVLAHPDAARQHYMNRASALTAARRSDVASGHPVGKDSVNVPPKANARAKVSPRSNVQPTREARLGPHGSAHGAPSTIASRNVVANRTPSTRASSSSSGKSAPRTQNQQQRTRTQPQQQRTQPQQQRTQPQQQRTQPQQQRTQPHQHRTQPQQQRT
ncbi:MAG TPA: DUF6600 domain-containing protein, partial [Bryobacteraceae bacterium]|nr:DUF6600 domain-containing protein [Bryobacteraceae bacterium]